MLVELGKLAMGSLLLVTVFGAGLRLLRRETRIAGGGHLTLVATLPLGPGKSIHLVRVLDQLYLVGSAERALALLGQLPAQQATDFLQSEMSRGRSRRRRPAPPPDFSRELRRALDQADEA